MPQITFDRSDPQRFVLGSVRAEGFANSLGLKRIADRGPGAVVAIPHLLRLLQDKEWKIREMATRALIPHGQSGQRAVPALIPLLSDAQGRVRLASIEALTAIGPASRHAALQAFELLLDKHPSLCEAARQYFRRLSGSLSDFVPHLNDQLNSPESARCRAAEIAIQAMGH